MAEKNTKTTSKNTSIKKTSEKVIKNTPLDAKNDPLESEKTKSSEITLPKEKIDVVGLIRAYLHNQVQAESWVNNNAELAAKITSPEEAKKALNINE